MSKILLACFRDPAIQSKYSNRDIDLLTSRITPNNITPNPTKVINENCVRIFIFNPVNVNQISGASVCLGSITTSKKSWAQPLAEIPEGSFALFRTNEQYVELISDVVASRTIWFYHNSNIFLASTSQRAIIYFLQKFELNTHAVSWMLSSGCLGPGNSWDRQIKSMVGDSSVTLIRKSWTLKTKKNNLRFEANNLSYEENKKNLQNILKQSLDRFNLDSSRWALPLSGGYDSRLLLCLLVSKGKFKTLTWGSGASIDREDNDAFIARKLAMHYNLEHRYFSTDDSDESVEAIFNRFLVAGEGRVDHFIGYTDGFRIWKELFESGVEGIIRGDSAFGWKEVLDIPDALSGVGISLLTDYSNLSRYKKYGLLEQLLPKEFQKATGETLQVYIDRLQHEFRIPYISSALSDLKLSYVEISNPLLSRSIMECTHQIPDRMRQNRHLFEKVVKSMSPKVAFARFLAEHDPIMVLRSKELVDYLTMELNSSIPSEVVSNRIIEDVLTNLKVTPMISKNHNYARSPLKNFMKRLIPRHMRKFLRKNFVNVDYNLLALRIFISIKMNQILQEDANLLKDS